MDFKKAIGLTAVMCALLVVCFAEKSNSGYIFTSAKKLKIGENNELQLFRSGCTDDGSLKVGVYYSNKTLIYEKDYQLTKGETISLLNFEVPSVDKKSYYNGRLQINGTICDTSISGSDKVDFTTSKSDLVLIQTDKPFYKPGQTVKFRVFVLNKYLKLSGDANDVADVYIEDPHGTRLFEFNSLPLEKGITQRQFLLSDEPVKGSWRITVSRNGRKDSTNFDIKDYVLPKFDVKVNFPPFVLSNVKIFNVEVCAKYTYGESVKGILNLNSSMEKYYYSYNADKLPVLQESVKLDGCYNYTLNTSLIDINNESYRRIMVVANVVEAGTGVQVNKTEYIRRENNPLKINLNADQNQRPYFKPGLPYTGTLQVTNPDSTPASGELIEICATVSRQRVIYQWWSSRKVKFCSNYTASEKGYVKYSVLPQNVDSVSILLEARAPKYKKDPKHSDSNNLYEPRTSMSLSPFYSPSGNFVQIAPITKPLECGTEQPITLVFTSKNNTEFKFYYEIIKGGESIRKGEQSVSFNVKNDVSKKYANEAQLINQKETQLVPPYQGKSDVKEDCPEARETKYIPPIGEAQIKIPVDASLPPSFQLLIFYVREDKEIVADSQKINVDGCFNNKVDFQFGDKIKQPGTKTSINVETAPHSLCGLKVVDKSISLMDSKDQLTKDKIFQLLGGMDNNYYSPNPCDNKVPQPGLQSSRAILPRPPGLYSSSSYQDSYSSFQNAGYLVISNLILFTRPCQKNGMYNDDDDYAEGAAISDEYLEDMEPDGRPINIIPAGPVTTPVMMMTRALSLKAAPGGPSFQTQSAVTVRENFAETWLFDLVMTGPDGKYVSEETLPDTITDWVGNAVCISPEKGLGISNTTTITGFQAFFISYTLPISVIRGEEFYVVVSIFNYVDDALAITANLENSPGLEVVGDPINGDVCIHPDTSANLKLKLKATAVGKIKITVKAETAKSKDVCGNLPVYNQPARDAITQSLEVNAEGFPAQISNSVLFCSSDAGNNKFSQVVDLSLPDDVILDSARAYVDVTGNIMGPTIKNLNNLVEIPTGCGEQNIVKFMPNILVMDYLSSIRKLTDDIRNEATQNLYTGYQRELNYKHDDGSFSAFGSPLDKEGSMYLTAFVLNSFTKAQKYITIDQSLLRDMQDFISDNQQEDGCFPNIGKIVDYGFEGGLENINNSHALTAFVVKSLLEVNLSVRSSYGNRTVVELAMSCLKQDKDLTFYETFLYAYVLALAGNKEEANKIVEKIKPFVKSKDGMEYYHNPEGPVTMDIETAAYAIKYYLEIGSDISEVLPLVKYLSTNLNPTGGFYSTQDTVVGLCALTDFAKIVYKDPVDLSVTITGILEEKVQVTEDNKLVGQRNKVSKVPGQLKVDAAGKGCGLLQTSLRYNTKTAPDKNKFSLAVVGTCATKDCKRRRISVTVSYLPKGKKSGMSVVQIKMVSGMVPVKDSLQQIMNNKFNNILRFDVENNEVIVYFSEMSNTDYRFSFDVDEIVEVVNAQPANAKVFDYYSPENNAATSYSFGDQKKAPESPPKPKAIA